MFPRAPLSFEAAETIHCVANWTLRTDVEPSLEGSVLVFIFSVFWHCCTATDILPIDFYEARYQTLFFVEARSIDERRSGPHLNVVLVQTLVSLARFATVVKVIERLPGASMTTTSISLSFSVICSCSASTLVFHCCS